MNEKNNEIDLNSFYSGKKKEENNKKKKKSTKKKVLISLGCVGLALVILISSFVAYCFSVLKKINRDNEFNQVSLEELGVEKVIDENIINIALFGVDTREMGDFSGRSDSIMILSINKKTDTIKLVSVMRDSLVPIEKESGTTYGKINSAYASGGPVLAVKTLNKLFGLDIRDYATVNFYGMADIIDAVGGIEVEITQNEIDASLGINAMINEQCMYLGINPKDYYVKKPGVQRLNGVQAVSFARIRHAKSATGSHSDYGRTERQRLVMQLLLQKTLSSSVFNYPKIVNKLAPLIKTSLSNSEMLSFGLFLAGKPQMIQSRIPHNEYIIDDDYRGAGSSAVYYNYEFAGKVLRAFFYDNITPEDYFAKNGVDKTKWFTASGNYIKDEDDEPNPEELPNTAPPEDNDDEQNPEGSESNPEDTSSSDTSSDSSVDENNSSVPPGEDIPEDTSSTITSSEDTSFDNSETQ